MKTWKLTAVVIILIVPLLGAIPAAAQQPISLEEWQASESWPLHRPGDLKFDNKKLHDLRIVFDAMFPGPAGPTGELRPTTMVLDVFNTYFRGKPAVWIQWNSLGSSQNPEATAAPDQVIVDQQTFAALFRIAGGPGPRDWAGSFNVVHYGPGPIVNLHTEENGTASSKTLEAGGSVFEFATLPFLLPLMQLSEGQRFRVGGFERITHTITEMPLLVGKPIKTKDARGKEHVVWPVYLMNRNRTARVRFLVSPTAPYFYGYKFERVNDGTVLLDMTLRDWVALTPAVN